MTIAISLQTHTGLVLAADSALTFYNEGEISNIYYNATKVFQFTNNIPIGVLIHGLGNIGSISVADLLQTYGLEIEKKLNPNMINIKDVASQVYNYLLEQYTASECESFLGLYIGGYSSNKPTAEVWYIKIHKQEKELTQSYSLSWAGQIDALNRLILGVSDTLKEVLARESLPQDWDSLNKEEQERLKKPLLDQATDKINNWKKSTEKSLFEPFMPIKDACNLAYFLVETTINYYRYCLYEDKTVGGPIRIATITKNHGFQYQTIK